MRSPVLLAITGVLFLTAMDGVMKGLMQQHPVVVAVCLRFAMGGLVALAALAALRPPRPTGPEIRANLLRVPLVVVTAGSFFYGVSVLPLAEAIGLAFLAPCFIAVLGVIWLGERVDRTILFALAGGMAGMAVMLWPSLQGGFQGSLAGVGAILLSDLTYAVNIILLRKLAVRQHPATIVAFQNLGPALLLAPAAAWLWSAPGPRDLALFLVAGLLGTLGHLLLTRAFASADAARLAPTEYTSLVWAALIGYLAFAEVPSAWTWAGAALIAAGSLALTRR
jgi:S-adenosylmethionine uptake transporter